VKRRSLLSWLGVFAVGFLAGVVFSAWKLEHGSIPVREALPSAKEQDKGTDARSRLAGMEKMVAANPQDVQALVALGNEYFDAANHEKAVEFYQRALRIQPRDPDVLTDMGISYRKLGKVPEAVNAFRMATEVDPEHPIALFNLGLVLRDDLKDYRGALTAWEGFLKKFGDSPHAVMVRPWVKQLQDKLGTDTSSDNKGTQN
jgi:cytochrome c-type biogenesis protein CcmH/NrfG